MWHKRLGTAVHSGKWLGLAVALAILSGPALGKADSPDRVIQQCRRATGGKALGQVRSTLMEGVVRNEQGKSGRFTLWAAGPDRYRLDLEAGGRILSRCYNGKSIWRRGDDGLSTLVGETADRLRLEALLANHRWFEPKTARIAVAPGVTTTRWNGRDAFMIELALGQGRATIYVDQREGLLIGREFPGAPGSDRQTYGDYRLVDGVREPFSLQIDAGTGRYSLTVERVRHNLDPGAQVFQYPQESGDRPIPDLATLLDALNGNQAAIEKRREQYTCRKTEQTFQSDKSGRETLSETRMYDVTPVGGSFVDRLISVNGKALSTREQSDEDKRVEKQVRKLLDKKEDSGGIQISAADFLRVSAVSSPRRETYHGHTLIVFDFEPRAGYKPKNRAEQLVSKLAGNIWVDEGEKQIARVEAHLTEKFTVGLGFLASIAPATGVVLQQEKINDEVWMPAFIELNLAGRALFFKLNMHQVIRYSDYQKVGVKVDYTLPKPS